MAEIGKTPILDIVIPQSEDFKLSFTLTDASGTAIDITGATYESQIKDKVGGTLIATFASAIVSAVDGQFEITLSEATTAALDFNNDVYVWDLYQNLSSVKTKLVQGKAELEETVTT